MHAIAVHTPQPAGYRSASLQVAPPRPSKRPAETEDMAAVRSKRAKLRADSVTASTKAVSAVHHLLASKAAAPVCDVEGIANLFVLPEPAQPAAAAAALVEETPPPVAAPPPAGRITRRKSLGAAEPKKKLMPRTPEPPRVIVANLTVAELKAELAARGLPLDGRKADLQMRLSAALEPSPPNFDDEQPRVVLQKRKLSMIPEQEEDVSVPAAPVHTEDVSALTVAQLKERLAKMGLSTSGLKGELRERLQHAMASEHIAAGAAPGAAASAATADTDAACPQPVEEKKRPVLKARRGKHTRSASVTSMEETVEEAPARISAPVDVAVAVAAPAPEPVAEEAVPKTAGRRGRKAAPAAAESAAAVEPESAPVEEAKSRCRRVKVCFALLLICCTSVLFYMLQQQFFL